MNHNFKLPQVFMTNMIVFKDNRDVNIKHIAHQFESTGERMNGNSGRVTLSVSPNRLLHQVQSEGWIWTILSMGDIASKQILNWICSIRQSKLCKRRERRSNNVWYWVRTTAYTDTIICPEDSFWGPSASPSSLNWYHDGLPILSEVSLGWIELAVMVGH